MARLLLVASFLATLGLGALAIAGAPGRAAGASATTGDRWLWSGPPSASQDDPAYYDLRRHVLSILARNRVEVVWSMPPDSARAWTAQPAMIGQTSRPGPPLLCDPVGDRLLGLHNFTVQSDTCCTYTVYCSPVAFPLGSQLGWTPVPMRGASPLYRDQAMTVLDSRRERMLMWGGFTGQGRQLDSSVGAFDLSSDSASWSSFNVSAPPLPVQGGSAVYDSLTDRLFVYAGRDSNGANRAEVYSLDLAAPTGWDAWTPTDTVSTPGTRDLTPQLLLDAARRRLLFVTAMVVPNSQGVPPYGQRPDSIVVWQLDLVTHAGWSVVPYSGPSPNVLAATFTFDPERNRLEVFGGAFRQDLYELVLDGAASWVCAEKSDQPPHILDGAPVMADRKHNQVIVIPQGGEDVWALHRGATDTWEGCPLQSPGPSTREFPVAAFDSTSRKGYLFGGGYEDAELGDLWQFTIDDSNRVTWQRLFLDGDVPSPRYGASAVFDPVRRRLVLFGGYDGRALSDAWELSFVGAPRWRRLPDRGSAPPARFLASAAYDSRRDGMVVYGGDVGSLENRVLLDDTWVLSFADGDSWQPINALGRAPAPRYGAGAVYDPVRDRMIVLWGAAYNGGRIDCLELDLADGPTWRDFIPTGLQLIGRGFFNTFYDPDREQAVIFGGEEAPAFTGPVVFPGVLIADFSANAVTSPPVLHGPPLALLGFVPNPTRDVETVAFDLPVDADVRARLYDARGRLVRDLGPQHYVAGRHLLLWDGKDKNGIVPPSGMYFVRLSALGKDFSGKFVLVK